MGTIRYKSQNKMVLLSMTPELLDEASRRFDRYREHHLSPDAGQQRAGGTGHA